MRVPLLVDDVLQGVELLARELADGLLGLGGQRRRWATDEVAGGGERVAEEGRLRVVRSDDDAARGVDVLFDVFGLGAEEGG